MEKPVTLRRSLPELPRHMARLRIDERGYPVPWFVQWFGDRPDFRIVDSRRIPEAVSKRRCWICGNPLGSNMSFVVGPLAALNAISSEPPSHRECAVFAVRACPFLALPKAQRREANLPAESIVDPAGVHFEHNPGVMLVWTTRSYKPFPVPAKPGVEPGVLFDMGPADAMQWYCEGRPARRAEIEAALERGLPNVVAQCRSDQERAQLGRRVERFTAELPA